jgi:hypothetical protein
VWPDRSRWTAMQIFRQFSVGIAELAGAIT